MKTQLFASIALLFVFVLDLLVPLGVAVGVLYVLCFLFVYNKSRNTILTFGIITVLLTLVGFLVQHTPDTFWMVYANRAISVFVIFIVTALAIQHRNLQERTRQDEKQYIKNLEKYNEQLARRDKAIDSSLLFSITDTSGKIVYANKKFCEISKYSVEELLGQDHRILNAKYHSHDFFKDLWQTLAKGGTWQNEVCNKAKDGSHYWVDAICFPIYDNNGKIIQYFSLRIPVNERKEIEVELKTKNIALKRMVNDLNDRNNKLQQFNYIVSHNLRSPIANIIGLANVMKMPNVSMEEKLMIVEKIYTSTLRMEEMTKDLSTILASRSALNTKKEKVNIPHILKSVTDSIDLQLQESDAVLQTNIAADAEELFTIKSYIESILNNLLSNAIKYRSAQRKLRIAVSTERKEENLLLKVSDNGRGIDLTTQGEYVFGLYKRFHLDTEGKGLGLHMAKTQIEALGGKITVESEVEKGTTFTIILPVA